MIDTNDMRNRLFFSMIERWGMSLTVPDGRDERGATRWMAASPEYVVTRALEIADLAVDVAEKDAEE